MKINCVGFACPLPVIKTKQFLMQHKGEVAEVLVDNEVATQNLTKMATQLGLSAKTEKQNDRLYVVTIEGEIKENAPSCKEDKRDDYVVVLAGDTMGTGVDELGAKLLEGFVYSLTEQDVLPKYVLCYNSGVKLVSENAKTIEDLKTLSSKGVNVLACGLCLDYYGLKDKVQVGEITNMYRIVELMRSFSVVRP